MGKYIRNAKITGEVAVMEVTQSSLGVRTRAKTLALQRLQKSTAASSGTSYLQLRSRRLVKHESKKQQNPHPQPKEKETTKANPNPNPNSRTSSRLVVEDSRNSCFADSVSCSKNEEGFSNDEGTPFAVEEASPENNNDVGMEASFGENVLETEGRERSTRETTPCSLIRGSDTIGTPGSTTRPATSTATNRRAQNAMRRNIPTSREMEEFFAVAEQQQQRRFTEKYNFNPVNDMPLPGRYEWVRVQP